MFELPCAHTIDAHLGLAWQQFLHHLTAGAAWHPGSSGCIALGIDAAHGQFNRLFALADRCEKGDSLGTDAQPITGVFHIAAVPNRLSGRRLSVWTQDLPPMIGCKSLCCNEFGVGDTEVGIPPVPVPQIQLHVWAFSISTKPKAGVPLTSSVF